MEDPETVAHVEWLAGSIAFEGVKKPLEVFSEGEDVFVADGHCRLAGAMLAIARGADILAVPCVPEAKATNDVDRKLNQILSNSGKHLSPLEAGVNIKYAIDKGWSVEAVARKLGKSTSYVYGALEFQSAPAEVHAAVKAGEISATEAAKVVKTEKANAPAVIKAAVEVAKAAGKTKATAKHLPVTTVRKAGASNPEVVSFVLGDVVFHQMSTLAQELNITIKGRIHNANRAVWEEVANRILDALEGRKVA
jgi:ParB-like chromosome segregation protein Spo0J